jgi:hypothetical protein
MEVAKTKLLRLKKCLCPKVHSLRENENIFKEFAWLWKKPPIIFVSLNGNLSFGGMCFARKIYFFSF